MSHFLPLDVIKRIVHYADVETMITMMQVSKHYNAAVDKQLVSEYVELSRNGVLYCSDFSLACEYGYIKLAEYHRKKSVGDYRALAISNMVELCLANRIASVRYLHSIGIPLPGFSRSFVGGLCSMGSIDILQYLLQQRVIQIEKLPTGNDLGDCIALPLISEDHLDMLLQLDFPNKLLNPRQTYLRYALISSSTKTAIWLMQNMYNPLQLNEYSGLIRQLTEQELTDSARCLLDNAILCGTEKEIENVHQDLIEHSIRLNRYEVFKIYAERFGLSVDRMQKYYNNLLLNRRTVIDLNILGYITRKLGTIQVDPNILQKTADELSTIAEIYALRMFGFNLAEYFKNHPYKAIDICFRSEVSLTPYLIYLGMDIHYENDLIFRLSLERDRYDMIIMLIKVGIKPLLHLRSVKAYNARAEVGTKILIGDGSE